MNELSDLLPEHRILSSIQVRAARTALSGNRVAAGSASKTAGKRPRAVDCRIAALEILALTLLREIQSLEGLNIDDDDESSQLDLPAEIHRFESELIRNALVKTGGRQRRAARLLGMKVTTLNAKIRRYRIDIASVKQ